MGLESGDKGIITGPKVPFGLSAVSFCSSAFLLSNTDIKANLFSLPVHDVKKSNGLNMIDLTVVNTFEAQKLAIKKFGNLENIATEKTKRAEKSKENWLLKKEIAVQEKKPMPNMPDLVRKENEKANPQHWNFVGINQRFYRTAQTCEIYGLYWVEGAPMFSDVPSIVVTNNPEEYVALSESGVLVMTNLVEAVTAANPGSTILVDMLCDLPKMIASCDRERCSAIIPSIGDITIGGQAQNETLMLNKDLRIDGTDRCLIQSTDCVIWISTGVHVFNNIKLKVAGGYNIYTHPTLVLCEGMYRLKIIIFHRALSTLSLSIYLSISHLNNIL